MVPDAPDYNGQMPGRQRTGGLPLLLLTACIPGHSADFPPEVIQLARTRAAMAQNLARLPDYTCLQTIERTTRTGLGRKPRLLDTVRIEVALVNGNELFAWPGSGKFTDTGISDLVTGGAIGNGNFALHAKSLFQSTVATFTYEGMHVREGHLLRKWNYVVPQILSGYTLRVTGAGEAIVGYHGSIWADANTLDLVRLEVEADDIPPVLRIATARDSVEYARVSIGSERFLLPSMSELEMVDITGSASLNRTRFTRCRQYSGESRLVFDEPEEPAPASGGPQTTVVAAAGVKIDLALEQPLVFTEAAVGDPILARLKKPVRLADGTVVPQGAFVHGRLTALRDQQMVRVPGRAVGLRFFEMESGNLHVKFDAGLESIETAQPGIRLPQLAFGPRNVPVENATIVGSVFFVQSNIQRLSRGLRMVWRTTTLNNEGTE